MIICMFSKFIASLLAIFFVLKYSISLPLQAFLIGIFPIWSEVLASYTTNVEPARVQNKFLIYLDGVMDVFVFILVPSFWFWLVTGKTQIEFFGLLIFFCCGFFRIIRFITKGLNREGKFSGLPVTYTGYIWIVLIGIYEMNIAGLSSYLSLVLLVIVSIAMVTKKIQISPSR